MLNRFELLVPTNLNEALTMYKEIGNENCKILAGGTDVLVELHSGKKSYPCLIDIKNIPEIKNFDYTPQKGLYMGALTTHRKLEMEPFVKSIFPALYEGVSQVGSVQIRHRGTIGGNICNAAPSADSLGPLLALNATVFVQGISGRREISFQDFFVGAKKTVLQEGELLTHIFVPSPPSMSSSAYTKFTRRNSMDLALLGAAVSLTCEEDGITCKSVFISLSTAAPTPMRAKNAEEFLVGKELTEETMKEAGRLASAEAKPRSSWRSSAEYRHELLRTTVPKTISTALQRVQKGAGF